MDGMMHLARAAETTLVCQLLMARCSARPSRKDPTSGLNSPPHSLSNIKDNTASDISCNQD